MELIPEVLTFELTVPLLKFNMEPVGNTMVNVSLWDRVSLRTTVNLIV